MKYLFAPTAAALAASVAFAIPAAAQSITVAVAADTPCSPQGNST